MFPLKAEGLRGAFRALLSTLAITYLHCKGCCFGFCIGGLFLLMVELSHF